MHCEGRRAELKEWASKVPDLRIAAIDLTEEENKKIDEALFQIYQIPESEQGEPVKFYIGEDYMLEKDFRYANFQ
jgi:hypothetical protein